MLQQLAKLSSQEGEQLMRAPLLVCILIAGADDDIDRKEIKKAIQVTQEKLKRSNSSLTEFYKLMAEDFEDKLKVLIQSFPPRAAARNPLIERELSLVTSILSKIDKLLAMEYYKSLLEIAEKVAASSGGMLGIKSVGAEEAKFITLPMIKAPV